MLKISRNNREEIENEYMALILNKEELLEITQVREEYLNNPKNMKIFKYTMECYREYKKVLPTKVIEKHRDFDSEYYVELLTNTVFYPNAWKQQLKLAEESIIKYFKEDLIKKMNKQLELGNIGFDEFNNKIKKLDEVVFDDSVATLTIKEIEENIDDNKIAIKLKNFDRLNAMLKFVQNDFLIIGATTGVGKSGLMLNFMNSLMDKYQCIYFNMEMSKSTIYKRLISIEGEVLIEHILKPTEHENIRIERVKKKIEDSKIIIEHQANDIKQIRSILAKQKDKDRHTILFIDHLGLCRCDNTKSLYEQATEVAKQLRQICFEYDCTVISASQLNRGAYNSEEITLSMLKDSGELENSASKVILLYRSKDSNKEDPEVKMKVEVAKNRDGVTGIIHMNYDKTRQIFKEVLS